MNTVLSNLYQIRGNGSFTILPSEREPTIWSAGFCRLVALAVGAAQYNLWVMKKRYHPGSEHTLRDMIFGRDFEWAEQVLPDILLTCELNLLSDSLFSLMYWLRRRFI